MNTYSNTIADDSTEVDATTKAMNDDDEVDDEGVNDDVDDGEPTNKQ